MAPNSHTDFDGLDSKDVQISDTGDTATLADLVHYLAPWRHDIDLGPFSTFDVADRRGPYKDIGHPEPRGAAVLEHAPDAPTTAVDLGCSEGGISFILEDAGWDVTAVDLNADELARATLCKFVRDSAVRFVQADVREFATDMSVGLIVACGVLYHIGSDVGNRDADAEQAFVDLLLAADAERVIIETNTTPWLGDYIRENGGHVLADLSGFETRDGVREFVVFEPSE